MSWRRRRHPRIEARPRSDEWVWARGLLSSHVCIWLYPRERFFSLRLLDDREAIIEACRIAWNQPVAEPGRIKSLCDFPWIAEISP